MRRSFAFLNPGPLIDRDVSLVQPGTGWIESFLAACYHPLTQQHAPEVGRVTRQGLLDFLYVAPGGHFPGDASHERPPAYHFWIVQALGRNGAMAVAGSVALRIGDTPDLRMYVGHLGYNVFPPRQGQHLAERACRLLLPLARQHGLTELWITANPENIASRRTCERLGATLVDTVAVPKKHELHRRGERFKCRYRLGL